MVVLIIGRGVTEARSVGDPQGETLSPSRCPLNRGRVNLPPVTQIRSEVKIPG
jgi:hypothetical protein